VTAVTWRKATTALFHGRHAGWALSNTGGECPMQTRYDEFRAKEFRARASECQRSAKQFDGLIRSQYEALAHQWLKVAEQAEQQAAANPWRRKAA